MSERRPHILLGVTGSVAAKLTPKLVSALQELGEVEVVATEPARYFWDGTSTGTRLWTEADEWPGRLYQKDQEVPHIALGDWADVLVIAPLTATTLAKLALGLADNLLTSVYYAWPTGKPVVVAPAMNTRMWLNPLTRAYLDLLRERTTRHRVILPVSKRLACGTTGFGAMAEIETIKQTVSRALAGG